MTSLGRATFAGLSLGLFALLGSLALGFWAVPTWLGISPFINSATALWLGVGAAASLVSGILFCLWLTGSLGQPLTLAKPPNSTELFGRHLVGLGFAFVLDAIFCIVLMTALSLASCRIAVPPLGATSSSLSSNTINTNALGSAVSGQPASTTRGAFASLFGADPTGGRFAAVLFLTSSMVAILGALFFLSNSIWEKMGDQSNEDFDANLFWAGLWFRLGEALSFNLVLFLLILTIDFNAPEDAGSLLIWLPLMSLLVGMFLKPGEKMVFGIAERMFAAFSALVPTSLERKHTLKIKTLDNPKLFDAHSTLTPSAEKLFKALKHVRGVTRVLVDPELRRIEVEYDEDRVSVERIQHEAEIHGL